MFILEGAYRQLALMQREICQSEQRYYFKKKGFLYLKDIIPKEWSSPLSKNPDSYLLQELYEAFEPCVTYLSHTQLSRPSQFEKRINIVDTESKKIKRLNGKVTLWIFLHSQKNIEILLWPKASLPFNRYWSHSSEWISHKLTHLYSPKTLTPLFGSVLLMTQRSLIQIKNNRPKQTTIEFNFEKTNKATSSTHPIKQSS